MGCLSENKHCPNQDKKECGPGCDFYSSDHYCLICGADLNEMPQGDCDCVPSRILICGIKVIKV